MKIRLHRILVIIVICTMLLIFGCDSNGQCYKKGISCVEQGLMPACTLPIGCSYKCIREERFIATDDGFSYYYNEDEEGAYLLDIPDIPDITIPENVDGKRVVELGYEDVGIGYSKDYRIDGEKTKNLTIKHEFEIKKSDDFFEKYVDFPSLETLTFIDFLYCNLSSSEDELIVPHYIGRKSSNIPDVRLKKSERVYSLEDFKPKVIIIPEYVTIIEKGVFDGLTDVVIKTSYESVPEGWEKGWNAQCEVVWGQEIEYLSFYDCIQKTEDGFVYYYNPLTDEGVYILCVPEFDRFIEGSKEVVIPEYINGQKVRELGNRYESNGYPSYYSLVIFGVEKLTIQHEFNVTQNLSQTTCGDYIVFQDLKKLIFIDYLYCNLTKQSTELIVPWYIGEDPRNQPSHWNSKFEGYPSVELKKSERVYSLEDFKPKVIIIPEYVTIIEKGVFDGLTDVVIKTSYESVPEGWEEGWNGQCEVVWGQEIE